MAEEPNVPFLRSLFMNARSAISYLYHGGIRVRHGESIQDLKKKESHGRVPELKYKTSQLSTYFPLKSRVRLPLITATVYPDSLFVHYGYSTYVTDKDKLSFRNIIQDVTSFMTAK